MRLAFLLAVHLTALPLCLAETTASPAPVKPQAAPAAAPDPAKPGKLTAEEQRLLRNARAKANKVAEIAALLKEENEAYRVAKEAKDAKKPKPEVDALYAKARTLRAARETKRDAAILAASPELKPLVEKAAARAKAAAGTGASPKSGTTPKPSREADADEGDD